ncbi:MAG TPA: phenylalanine--tRNA ligase subunit beta [Firmicutes bacterium]|jgi:phenylalanyl-tRNA synthetase beta chain|nr:phenylalanine--tRNA ligase subunit beta [Bacillota bacterium]HOQ24576.1 phenylalanine--tRNA ligase subunit beta [Bacillota bacterium]HPT67840.1 phenylalanine--tRNA ligase subunit beta [Bacillota bacterium]
MRVSMEWLREYVATPLNAEELADRLTMAGIAVEYVEKMAQRYAGIIVAEVLEVKPHPQADNLQVCRMGVGTGELTVITAAHNIKVGDRVPLAQTGAVLLNGTKIEPVTFKGVTSQGMLCSETELGLAKESTGIMLLPGDSPVGGDVAKVLGLDDEVLVLELTANRADCYGMLGVAYEVAAVTGLPVKLPEFSVKEENPVDINEMVTVKVLAPDLCPRYAGRVLTDLKIEDSPLWLKRRLLAAGLRPINNIVDLTNYVMLELNQPLHAFDLERLAGREIVVRRGYANEKMQTLDGVERELNPEQLVIADAKEAQCIAGVMGGGVSEVTAQTRQIFLESAYFAPVSVRRTANALAMRTEAALRFGKGGIDPSGTVLALDRLAHLVEVLSAGRVARGVIDHYPQPIAPRIITASAGRINRLLGTELAPGEMQNYLKALNLEVTQETADQLRVEIPTRRPDLENEADLAEEVARLYGYDRIPVTVPASKVVGRRNLRQMMEKTIRETLTGFGLTEIITYSFHGESAFERMGLAADDPLRNTVRMWVPLSEEGSMMRTTLLAGMLQTLEYNAKRRQNDVAFFEQARVYLPQANGELPAEPLHLAGGLMGRASEPGWNQPARKVDFYDGKGLLEQLFGVLRVDKVGFSKGYHPLLHPGRTAQVTIDKKLVGYVGEIHPKVAQEYDLVEPVVLWELNLEELVPALGKTEITYQPLPKYPGIARDLAVLAPEEVKAAQIQATIARIGAELLEEVFLFDLYTGENIPAGHRSLAFGLKFRAADRTLQEDEVNALMEQIITVLKQEFGAEIR